MNMLPSMLIAATMIGGSLQVHIPYAGNHAGIGCKPELPEATENVQEQYSAGSVQEFLERLQKPEIPEDSPSDKEESEVQSFAEQVVALVNAERAKVNLPALTMTTKLNEAALVRAKETVQSFSHTRPNGSSFRGH